MPIAPAKHAQLSFFKKTRSDYGGTLMTTRACRAGPRPLDTRNTMHLVLRSSKARGEWSFLRYRRSIEEIFKRFGSRYGVRIVNLANVGNHLHLQIKLSNRCLYAPFIRASTAAIAMVVTGAGKGAPMRDKLARRGSKAGDANAKGSPANAKTRSARSFWDYRPWTRIVKSYRAILKLRDYFAINEMEGQGYDRAEARWFITGRFAWDQRGPP